MAAKQRARKVHVQQDLFEPPKAKRKRRKGSKPIGRPPKDGRAGSPHKKRESFKASEPVHVVLRAIRQVGSLRRRHIYRAMRWATLAAVQLEAFRIVHVSIQRTHVHLLVEAKDRLALARGMQGFQISAAKHINATLVDDKGKRRRGSVFPDRYHAEVIRSRRQARHALAYVLNNWRKHDEHRSQLARGWKVDPFSTGVLFDGWTELADRPTMWSYRDTYEPMIVWLPKTWLLSEGWRIYGRIRTAEVPGKRRAAA